MDDVGFFKNHATPLSTTALPQDYASINFNKAVVFDGFDDNLKIPYSFEGAAELSVFVVFQSTIQLSAGYGEPATPCHDQFFLPHAELTGLMLSLTSMASMRRWR